MKKGLLSAALIVLTLVVTTTGCNPGRTEREARRTVVSETLICDISGKSVYSRWFTAELQTGGVFHGNRREETGCH